MLNKGPDPGSMRLVYKSISPFSPQPSFDHPRDKTSPEKQAISPSSSPEEESSGEQRSVPSAQATIREEGILERKSPTASAKLGIEAGDPAGQGRASRVRLDRR